MDRPQWTREQRLAIDGRGGSLIVSAAAGSGKTAVLVERVVARLCDPEQPCSADRLLVVTFTRAAASEMRQRISERLDRAIREHPNDGYLLKQKLLLCAAHICTIDSFCCELCREFFYQLDLSPDFKIADAQQLRLFKNDTLQEVIEAWYAEGSSAFMSLAGLLSPGRDDRTLTDTVLHLHEFMQSYPFPDVWVEKQLAQYQQKDLLKTGWGQITLQYTLESLERCGGILAAALEAMKADEGSLRLYEPVFSDAAEQISGILGALKCADWDDACDRIRSFAFKRRKPKTKTLIPALESEMDEAKDEVNGILKRIRPLFSVTQALYKQDVEQLYPQVKALFELTLDFDRAFSSEKRRRGVVDFSDVQHFCVQLLVKRDGSRTPLAQEISGRFEEILVDEYQDTNETQDMLFSALSQNESNLFFVGDVKQSIYRFRQAMPEIFLRRRRALPGFDGEHYPGVVTLGKNFRSRFGVTESVNFIFRQLMSESLGDVFYTAAEELVNGAKYCEKDEPDVELLFCDTAELSEDDEADAAQARIIGRRIEEMLRQGMTVNEKGIERPLCFGDICILLRSQASHASRYARELERMGIPVQTEESNTFFGSLEISFMLSLLRILDNPLQDIPLLAVMLSPVFAFTPDELAKLRVAHPSMASIYSAVLLEREESGELAEKCTAFLQMLDTLRRRAAVLSVSHLLGEIDEATGYSALVQAMPGGTRRRANLQFLSDYAKRFEQSGKKSLSAFIRFMTRIEEEDENLARSSQPRTGINAVQVMTIHKSKGLEFPVCIVAGCGSGFNKSDMQEAALVHSTLGVGLKLMQNDALYTTFQREAIRLEIERSALSEEMRVLYVAMTRARERLVLVSAVRDLPKVLHRLSKGVARKESLSPAFLRDAKSYAEWIMTCALRHPDAQELRALAGMEPDDVLPCTAPWRICICAPAKTAFTQAAAEEEIAKPQEDIIASLQERIGWQYPFRQIQRIPAKISASEFSLSDDPLRAVRLREPSFVQGGGLSPAQQGTAHHSFLQHCDFTLAPLDVHQELLRLYEMGLLTEAQRDAIREQPLRAFFKSDLFRRICASPKVYRELRFCVELPLSWYDRTYQGETGERMVLQGVADLVFEEDGGLVVVDYKTDRLTQEEFCRLYGRQVALYAYAAEEMLGMPVREQLLYSLHLSKTLVLNNSHGE